MLCPVNVLQATACGSVSPIRGHSVTDFADIDHDATDEHFSQGTLCWTLDMISLLCK